MMDKNIVILLWFLPLALSLHVIEEFAYPGGLRQWIRAYKPGRPKSTLYYFIANASILIGAYIIAFRAVDIFGFRIYLALVAIVGSNGISHIRGTLQKKQFCPGVFSSMVLYLPLTVLSFYYFLAQGKVDILSAVVCACIGVFIGYYVGGIDIRKKDIDLIASNR
jgi:hypothetical protein